MYKNFDIAKRFTKIDFELKFKHKKMSHPPFFRLNLNKTNNEIQRQIN